MSPASSDPTTAPTESPTTSSPTFPDKLHHEPYYDMNTTKNPTPRPSSTPAPNQSSRDDRKDGIMHQTETPDYEVGTCTWTHVGVCTCMGPHPHGVQAEHWMDCMFHSLYRTTAGPRWPGPSTLCSLSSPGCRKYLPSFGTMLPEDRSLYLRDKAERGKLTMVRDAAAMSL